MSSEPQAPALASRLYDAAYRTGFAPWDIGPPKPELVDLIEGPAALSPGRAVDLGCGAGTKSVYLAQHGWRVTGVDVSAEALRLAAQKAAGAGCTVDFVQCDLLSIEPGALAGPFDLLLDIGCCHSLRGDDKATYAAQIATLAEPGATLFLFAFTRGPLSVTPAEVDTHFTPYWELVEAIAGSERRTPDARPGWHRFRRRP